METNMQNNEKKYVLGDSKIGAICSIGKTGKSAEELFAEARKSRPGAKFRLYWGDTFLRRCYGG
ncbi:MAG: hypothetical protein LBT45_02470 [Rickettsiales bacterium]|jgi:hypothetical protein|nr:hypothetical protein [Rickettsiales bacterium]